MDHLENLAQSSGLMVLKTQSDEDSSTVNAFLNTEDFFFEVSINLKGIYRNIAMKRCQGELCCLFGFHVYSLVPNSK